MRVGLWSRGSSPLVSSRLDPAHRRIQGTRGTQAVVPQIPAVYPSRLSGRLGVSRSTGLVDLSWVAGRAGCGQLVNFPVEGFRS